MNRNYFPVRRHAISYCDSEDPGDAFLYSDSDDGYSHYGYVHETERTNKALCQYCKQWGKPYSQCQYCGARIDG